ncbi:MAG: glycosyltransferase family 4 protein, partial [Kofleriaceae bacterium]
MRVVVIGGWAPSLIKFRGPLLAALVARGHQVTAMAADGSPEVTAALGELGVAFEPLFLQRAGLDPRADLRTLITLTTRLRERAPDAVLAYTIKPVIYGMIAAALAGVGRRGAMITGLGYALTRARSPKQRVVAQVARGLYRLGLGRSHVVFFQNPDDRRELEQLGVVPRHVRVAMVRGSGVDLDHYAPSPLPDGPPRFLFVGRLLRDKGIGEFAEAAARVRARHPDARFQIVGWIDPNPESVSRADLDRWIAAGAVEYLGATDDIRPHLRAAHALILPSYREGTPRSVLEAMSMGRAVITTDAPGCRETVVHGESGLLVPVGDAGALA